MDLIIFIVALSILVLVHEFGHYFAAKITGVKVEEFGLGLPPRIVGGKKWGTVWSLNWLPIGGFCKLYGEDPSTSSGRVAVDKSSFQSKSPAQKGLIVLGGVFMNLLMAVLIFSTVYTIMGIPRETDQVKIIGVSKNSPAEKAGLKENDIVTKINGKDVKKSAELTEEIGKFKGKMVDLFILREGQTNSLSVLVRENPPQGEGSMGIAISNTEMEKIKWYEFYKGIGAGFKEAVYWGDIIAGGVFKMITGLLTGHPPKDVAGPIGMYQATTSIKQNQGMLAVIHFFGIVSVNLGIVNVLPFPALDGGRIVFVLYELLTKKRANEKLEATVNNIGMMILLGLILLITVGDVARIFLH